MNNSKGFFIALLISLLFHIVMVCLGQKTYVEQSSLNSSVPSSRLLTVSLLQPNSLDHDPTLVHSERVGRETPADSVEFVKNSRLTKLPELLGELPEIELEQSVKSNQAIKLRLIIGADGKVLLLNVLSSSFSKAIEEQVVSALYHSSYRPGEMSGKAVNAEMLLSISID